ncbi:hypothetical protein ACQV2L_23320, partial [Pantoea allii]|uniref:hypothetical protein n=1 Tax=Pantoea allii TaxID=574096 RepID=UPI003D3137C7
AVLVAASLPRRPGLRSLLSAPDASGKPPPVRAYIFPKDRLRLSVVNMCNQKSRQESLIKQEKININKPDAFLASEAMFPDI